MKVEKLLSSGKRGIFGFPVAEWKIKTLEKL
jgi:hypothetical protein